ncbi:nitronate monooxygenase [Leucobacter exalbidus]|uniref:Nitronate monooxygenase n=1 Tax=Leucobacter exalbidus TaxID=662960 RepID=A0A940T3C6_9MICO|nr:nitronate monooxygenase [Leucobacter exalbidus]MBP1325683.1 nitronate monooxygenase [Leucobacter exalbidus]
MSDDAQHLHPEAVARWELNGGTWRVSTVTQTSAAVELRRCDGGEVVDRLTLTQPRDLCWARTHALAHIQGDTVTHHPRSSQWSRDLGITAPIVCAPMGGVAGGALAHAVSRAGGLGMIGMGSAGSVAALERELAAFAAAHQAAGEDDADIPLPFGIGMVGWGIERDPEMFERALAARPALLSVSFGDWVSGRTPEWVTRARAMGIRTITQAATADEARAAEAAGIDSVVARGLEGGGHGDHREPLGSLLAEVIGAVSIPVLAAGAISTAADVRRVLDAGSAAAWVGTAFTACTESLVSPAAREVLIAAHGRDTRVTRVFDIALDRPWPAHFPERLIDTPFIVKWHGREAELAANEQAKQEFRAASAAGDFTVVPVDAGLGVDHITRVHPAAEVVRELTPVE